MAVTINNIKVDFNQDPPEITFLQGCNMNIENVRDTLREIEQTEEARMFDSFTVGSGMIVRADGNYPYGVETAAMDITILPPFIMKFEAGATPFQTSFGSILGTFVDSPGAIVQINQAKGALKVDVGGGASAQEIWEYLIDGGGGKEAQEILLDALAKAKLAAFKL